MKRSKSLWLGVALVAMAVAACDSTSAGTPAVIALTVRTQTPFVGDTLKITARVIDGEDNALNDAKVTYSSGNSSVASVDDAGLIKAVAIGTTIITGKSGSASGNVGLTVSAVPAAGGE